MAAFLTSAVRSRLNILICGGTGAGMNRMRVAASKAVIAVRSGF